MEWNGVLGHNGFLGQWDAGAVRAFLPVLTSEIPHIIFEVQRGDEGAGTTWRGAAWCGACGRGRGVPRQTTLAQLDQLVPQLDQ
jgi:hypothetical protein